MPIEWIILELLNACFGIYMMFTLSKGLLKESENHNVKLNYAFFVVAVTVFFFIDTYFSTNVVIISLKTILISFTISLLCFRAKIYWSVISAFLFYLVTSISELIATSVITLIKNVEFELVMNTTLSRFYTILLTDFIVFIFIKIIARLRKGNIDTIPTKLWCSLIIMSVFSILTTLQIIFSNISEQSSYSFLSALSIIGLLYSNALLFAVFEGVLRRNETDKKLAILEAQFSIQREHNTKIAENQFYIQQMSHDFKQHIQGFLHLCENGNFEELANNIRQIAQQQQRIKPTINTDNPMLDAILTSKKEIAEKNNILCIWDIRIPSNIDIPIIDLGALLGNAIDNAIEACQKTDEDRFILLRLYNEGKVLLCEIRNSIGTKPEIQDGELRTSKSDKKCHGIGLKSMAECCRRINGKMNYDFDETTFELRFLIPW